jgi:hypothetical protein
MSRPKERLSQSDEALSPHEEIRPPDLRLADVMSTQYGYITRSQALDLEVSDHMLRSRVARGLLVPAYPWRSGVYLDPAAHVSPEQPVMAAVLAAGDGAFGSHETAAWLRDIPSPSAEWTLEVTTPGASRPRRGGSKRHRSYLIEESDIEVVRSIPVTRAAVTIVDLSVRWSRRALGRAIDDATRRGLTTLDELRDTALRLSPAPGRSLRKIMECVQDRSGLEGTASELEAFVLDSLRHYSVKMPVVQYEIEVAGRKRFIDQCYPAERVAVEAVGYEWHVKLRDRWDADRMRANELVLAGFAVLEFTSAFNDWQIAEQVARAIGDPIPTRPARATTFRDWKGRHHRGRAAAA